jgi:hypothetical protein
VALDELEAEDPAQKLEVPFRLSTLIDSLTSITSQRQHLHDVDSRQEYLEESAYDAARVQLARDIGQLERMGLSVEKHLRKSDLQNFMYEWLTALTEKLEVQRVEIAEKLGKSKSEFVLSSEHLPRS